MKRKKLTLNRETVRTLENDLLRLAAGGQSQGGACDNTQGKTQCDLAGCNLVCPETMGACDSLAFTCYNTCTAAQ